VSNPIVRRFLLAALALAAVCGGCDAAAHVRALQPPSVPKSPPLTLPAAPVAHHGVFQRGIDIDLYSYPGLDYPGTTTATVRYITSLHANAVSISFPFFMNGTRPGSVHATSATPTPAQLAVVITAAERAGLRVSLRPLLDEHSLGRIRVFWVPSKLTAWFAGYERFLKPYAQMAQREHVSEFIVGAELGGFSRSPRWNALDRLVSGWYHGTLACADNWDQLYQHGCGQRVVQTVDAYHPAVSHDRFLPEWIAYDRRMIAGTVETEVGIAAAQGAWKQPWTWHWPVRSVSPAVQVQWFTAACQAAFRTHLGGIYFWSVGLGTTIPHGPALTSQTTWAGGPAARAISSCFASIERTGK
jgi:hypothetical protein